MCVVQIGGRPDVNIRHWTSSVGLHGTSRRPPPIVLPEPLSCRCLADWHNQHGCRYSRETERLSRPRLVTTTVVDDCRFLSVQSGTLYVYFLFLLCTAVGGVPIGVVALVSFEIDKNSERERL